MEVYMVSFQSPAWDYETGHYREGYRTADETAEYLFYKKEGAAKKAAELIKNLYTSKGFSFNRKYELDNLVKWLEGESNKVIIFGEDDGATDGEITISYEEIE